MSKIRDAHLKRVPGYGAGQPAPIAQEQPEALEVIKPEKAPKKVSEKKESKA